MCEIISFILFIISHPSHTCSQYLKFSGFDCYPTIIPEFNFVSSSGIQVRSVHIAYISTRCLLRHNLRQSSYIHQLDYIRLPLFQRQRH